MDIQWPPAPLEGSEKQADKNDILERCLQMLETLEAEPIDESDFFSKKRKVYLDRIWNQWLEHAGQMKVSPDEVWVDLCLGKDSAKNICRTFILRYILQSEVYRPCLGPQEWHKVRTVNAAVTLEDAWAALVRNADMKVLQRHRQANPKEANFWQLRYSSRDNSSRNSPAYEVAQYIPELAKKMNLTLKQTFVKREATPEDIILMLDTFWLMAEDIDCTPECRVAFHCSMLLGGIGGWRPSSIVQIKYKDVEMAWLRDPLDSSKIWLVASITIHHVKQRKNRIQRHQRGSLTFTITLVPYRQLCLLTFLTSRAIADDAFGAGFTSPCDVISPKPLPANIDYVPLRWKPEMMDKDIVPISYNTYWKLWNRTLFVSGVRGGDEMRPYAMRVGGGSRLDGSLTAPLRNFILSNSTEVYETSYLPVHLKQNLMRVAYGNRVGQNDEVISLMSRVLMRRDPNAPIYLEKKDLEQFEKRRDLSILREAQKKAKLSGDKPFQLKIKARAKYLLDTLVKLKILEKRKEYFETVDKLRAKGQSADHLSHQNNINLRKHRTPIGASVAMRIGVLVRRDGTSPDAIIEKIVQYLADQPLEKVFPEESAKNPTDDKIAEPVRCLLCNELFANKSSLTRHVHRKHEALFNQPFSCPECRRSGENHEIAANSSSWSHHVAKFHGDKFTPNPKKHYDPPIKPAYCPLCEQRFTVKGYNQHYYKAHQQKLSYPFNCPECKKVDENHQYTINGEDEWLVHIRDYHNRRGGSRRALGAIMVNMTGEKRTYHPSKTEDCYQKRKKIRLTCDEHTTTFSDEQTCVEDSGQVLDIDTQASLLHLQASQLLGAKSFKPHSHQLAIEQKKTLTNTNQAPLGPGKAMASASAVPNTPSSPPNPTTTNTAPFTLIVPRGILKRKEQTDLALTPRKKRITFDLTNKDSKPAAAITPKDISIKSSI